MNGYTMLAESYKKLMNEGKVEKEVAEKHIRIYEFLATCDIDDLCIMVDSSAFNDIIRAFLRKAVKGADIGHHKYEAVMDGLHYIFDENTAKEVLRMAENLDLTKVKEARNQIVNRMDEFIAEWLNISSDTVNYWGGKVEAMDIAKRLVNAVLTDLIDGTPKERGGKNN